MDTEIHEYILVINSSKINARQAPANIKRVFPTRDLAEAVIAEHKKRHDSNSDYTYEVRESPWFWKGNSFGCVGCFYMFCPTLVAEWGI